MTKSKFFSLLLVAVISVFLIVAGCAPAATAPAPTTPAAKPASTAPATPAATTPAAPAATTPAATAPAPTAPASKTLSFKADTYTDAANGFSVQYPAEWGKDSAEGKGLVFAAKAASLTHFIYVYVYDTTDNNELIKLADDGFKASSGSNLKRTPFEQKQYGANSGVYTLVNWDYMGGAYNMDTYSFSTIHNGKYVSIGITVLSGNAKDKVLAEEIFGTLTFK